MKGCRYPAMNDPLANRVGEGMNGRIGIAGRRRMAVQHGRGVDGILVMHHGIMPAGQADHAKHRQQGQRGVQKDGSGVAYRHGRQNDRAA